MGLKVSLCNVFNRVSNVLPVHLLGAGTGALSAGFAASALGFGGVVVGVSSVVGLAVGGVGAMVLDLVAEAGSDHRAPK